MIAPARPTSGPVPEWMSTDWRALLAKVEAAGIELPDFVGLVVRGGVWPAKALAYCTHGCVVVLPMWMADPNADRPLRRLVRLVLLHELAHVMTGTSTARHHGPEFYDAAKLLADVFDLRKPTFPCDVPPWDLLHLRRWPVAGDWCASSALSRRVDTVAPRPAPVARPWLPILAVFMLAAGIVFGGESDAVGGVP